MHLVVMTADMREVNLGQRVSQLVWEALQLGAKQNKSPALPEIKYTWLLSLFIRMKALLPPQQLSNKIPVLISAPLWTEIFKTRQFIHIMKNSQSNGLCHSLQSHPGLPPFTGAGNFKGCQRKLKGTFFIRAECETYRGSASALNQPWLLDMLKLERSRVDQRETGGIRGRDWNRERYCERSDTAGKSNLARPHLCKSHQIFPFTYF